jgi:succinate dehydrogenase / fumarate reductase iron-sulfur subunit
MLFTAAKVSHLGLLPQGQPERDRRALGMVTQMDLEGFGGCTNYGECTTACPKEISLETIARMNRDFRVATFRARPESAGAGSS